MTTPRMLTKRLSALIDCCNLHLLHHLTISQLHQSLLFSSERKMSFHTQGILCLAKRKEFILNYRWRYGVGKYFESWLVWRYFVDDVHYFTHILAFACGNNAWKKTLMMICTHYNIKGEHFRCLRYARFLEKV